MADFFALLRKKLLKDTDRNFDQRFWAKFDGEFGREARAKSRISPKLWLPGLLAACFALVVGYSLWQSAGPGRDQAPRIETVSLSEEEIAIALASAADGDFLANFDIYSELDEMPIDEEEWDLLLSEDAV